MSQEQANAITQVLPMHKGDRQGKQGEQTKMKEILSGLVTKGTLTQAQMDSILTSMDKVRAEHQAAMEKIKNMTDTERQTYMKQLKDNKTDTISKMVEDKLITSEQAEAITNAMPQRPYHGQGGQMR